MKPRAGGRSLTPKDALFLIFALYAAAHFLTMRLYWDVAQSPIRGSDFSSYYTAGLLVREGRAASLYAVAAGDTILGDATSGAWAEAGASRGISRQHYYIYPPLFAVAAVPLTYLAFPAALDLWLALDLVLLVGFFLLYARSRAGEIQGVEIAMMVFVALFEFLPLIWALAVGQTSLIVLVLLTGSLLLWKRGADAGAGVLVGLATAIKLTPALLIVFFWWRGRRKIAIVSAITFVALQLLSIAALGWDLHRTFYLEIVPAMAGGTCYFLNQSLGALFNRMLTDGDVRNVALVSSLAARVLSGAAALALLAWSAPRLRAGSPGTPLGDDLQFGAVVLLTLIVSPISWSHHYLVALLPIVSLAGALGRGPKFSLTAAAALALGCLLISRKPHPDLFVTGPARLFNSAALAGALILLGLSLHLLRGRGAEAAR